MSNFGELLCQFRKRTNIKQEILAEKIHKHRNTISAWERGDFLPKHRDQILDLAKVLYLSQEETDQLLIAANYPAEYSIPQLKDTKELGSIGGETKNTNDAARDEKTSEGGTSPQPHEQPSSSPSNAGGISSLREIPLPRQERSNPLITRNLLLRLALVILVLIVLAGLIGFTLYIGFKPRIPQSQLNTIDWNNFTYPGLCNPNQGDHVIVKNGTAVNSGSQGRFFAQVYPPTFDDLTGDGQSEAIVPYGCSNTDPNSPIKGTVYVHVIIFSGYAAQPMLIGQFPTLSGQENRDYASVDFLYIDHGALHLIGEGFSKAKSTTFDQQFSLTYHWTGTQFEIEHPQIDSIVSLLPHPGNGQQLAYACPGMTEMEVQGIDQDKKNATWGPNQVASGGLTWEWWWVGPVQIQWKDQGGKVHEDNHVYMPPQYRTYVYHATCT